MPDDLSREIAEWLEATGHPFEMRALNALEVLSRDSDWIVQANECYTDLTTGSTRETDLTISWTSGLHAADAWSRLLIDVELTVVVECKTSSRPWVVLRHGPSESAVSAGSGVPLVDLRYASAHWRRRQPSATLDRFVAALDSYVSQRLTLHAEPGYSILDGMPSKGNSRDGSYDAVRQALSSSLNVAATTFLSYSQANISWHFPVVLTSARLFEAHLDVPSDTVQVREVDRTSVSVTHDPAIEFPVTILRPEAMPSLINDLETVPGIVVEFFATADPDLVSHTDGEEYMYESNPNVIATRLND